MNKNMRRVLYIGLSALMIGSVASASGSANAATKTIQPRVVQTTKNPKQQKKQKQPSLKQLHKDYNYMIKENKIGHKVIKRLNRQYRHNHSKKLKAVIVKDEKVLQETKIYSGLYKSEIRQRTTRRSNMSNNSIIKNRKNRKNHKNNFNSNGTYVIKRTYNYVTLRLANGKRTTLLRSHFKRGNNRVAKRAGFAKGPNLVSVKSMFSKYKPNNKRAVIPRRYRILPDHTAWLVGRPTRSIRKINHFKYVYYYNKQFNGWSYIGD